MMTITESAIAPIDFLRIGELTRTQLDQVLALALQMKCRPQKWYKALRGQSLVYLYKQLVAPSCVSFAAAAYRLGMQPITLVPDEFRQDDQRALANLGRTLSGYASAIAVHGLDQAALEGFARAADVPVINAETDEQRPVQVLADLFTLRERFGRLQGLRLAYVGPGGALARSLLDAGALAGMRVSLAMPTCMQPDRATQRQAGRIALTQGGAITITDDPYAAVTNADAVYSDSWTPASHAGMPPEYQITTALLAHTRPQAVLLHGAPAQPGPEVTTEQLDAPASLVWLQIANRLPIEQALIYLLISGKWEDRGEL